MTGGFQRGWWSRYGARLLALGLARWFYFQVRYVFGEVVFYGKDELKGAAVHTLNNPTATERIMCLAQAYASELLCTCVVKVIINSTFRLSDPWEVALGPAA